MAAFQNLVRSFRKAEAELARQLDGIRQAISTLEFGGAASPPAPRAARKGRGGKRGAAAGRKHRKLSAKARAAISRAQKRRWAKLKREAE
jgi:hypothetical protein